jgi:hypothetical protein
MGPIGCSETSVRNYGSTLRKILEERRFHLRLGGSLKLRTDNIPVKQRDMSIHISEGYYLRALSQYNYPLRAGRYGDRIPVGARYSAPIKAGPGANQPPLKWVSGLFPGSKSAGAWRLPSTQSTAEVKERVQL